jgi:thiamine biosynthesis protein ThiI
MMMRIAEEVAGEERSLALATGESIGQVASQTVENIAVIDGAARLPILRPLIGMDKDEIVAQAEEIGTFETSIVPDEDCCQLFVPRHPATRARLKEVLAEEGSLDLESLVTRALEGREIKVFS